MMCYRDRTFCSFNKECSAGDKCEIALTDKVKSDAEKWWGKPDAPICEFVDKPECFKSLEGTR